MAHLRNALGTSFHISPEHIRFALVSGRFTRDKDSLFDLRASDGNFASLDVELPAAYGCSSLSNGVISVRYHSNLGESALSDVSPEGIEEVSMPTSLSSLASCSNSPAPFSYEDLSREQRIALRAQLEDPFSIASKSCFEDDSDDDEAYDTDHNDSDSDIDEDLYSDDGEAGFESGFGDSDCSSPPSSLTSSPTTSPTCSSFWPSDSTKLHSGHLRHLLSIVPPRDSRREVSLRCSLLRYGFQCRILEYLKGAPNFISSNTLENIKLIPAIQSCPLTTPTAKNPPVSLSSYGSGSATNPLHADSLSPSKSIIS